MQQSGWGKSGLGVCASRFHDKKRGSSKDSAGSLIQNEAEDVDRLKGALETSYAVLRTGLARALGSDDKAVEALHTAYLRLESRPAIAKVRNPHAYLYRMALNIAANIRGRESRLVAGLSEAIAALIDDSPGPELTAIAKWDLSNALAALHRLPVRRREIFLARWRDELSLKDIAFRFRIHRRTVQKELARAEGFLRRSMMVGDLPASDAG